MKSEIALGVVTLFASLGSSQAVSNNSTVGSPIPQYSFQLSSPETLPIGAPGSILSAVFGCASDNSVFVQVVTLPAPGSSEKGDIALYAVRSATDIVQFRSALAPGYRLISPIVRYFAADSEVVALAYGIGIDSGDVGGSPDPKHLVSVLLKFDRKGALLSATSLEPDLHPEQVAAYSSGEVLLVAWDQLRKRTRLVVLDSQGTVMRDFDIVDNDPGVKDSAAPVLGIEIYPYGQDLLLIPDDTRRPILEVNEAGVVNTYTLHIPKEYERRLPISFSPRSWKFRMIPEQTAQQPVSTSGGEGSGSLDQQGGLAALQSARGAVLEFDPSDGNVMRQFNLPASGLQPVCENNGTFVFLGARNGKLEIAKGVVSN